MNSGEQFLHQRDPKMQKSQEVSTVVDYLNQNGENIPNQPDARIAAYIGFLANIDYVNDGIMTGDQLSIDRQVEGLVIMAEDVPESYFDLQRRIAREQGHGDIVITNDTREQMIEAIQADQRASLTNWAEYVTGDGGNYPNWFRYYAWESVIKLGSYDKEKGSFNKRSQSTTAPYPELNREALAYVLDSIVKTRLHGEQPDEAELAKLLEGANFGKLYAHAIFELAPDSPELKKNIEGSWTKFDKTTDPRIARRLSESLQGHGTGWCTAGETTAAMQLEGGDFFVYYSKDGKGKDTIPRIAIRMEGGEVAEVRGILPSQELEPDVTDIASEKLKDLPGGEEYIQRAADMKQLTALDNKLKADPEATLTREELRFLYELDRKIQGFGYDRDPRIGEILRGRNFIKDIEIAYGTKDHILIVKDLLGKSYSHKVEKHLDEFLRDSNHAEMAEALLSGGRYLVVLKNLDKFSPGSVNHAELADSLLEKGHHKHLADNLEKLDPGTIDQVALVKHLSSNGHIGVVADNLHKFAPGVVDQAAMVSKLYDQHEYARLSNILGELSPAAQIEVARTEIQKGNGLEVMLQIYLLKTELHSQIANMVIESGRPDYVAHCLDRLEPGTLTSSAPADYLIKSMRRPEKVAWQLEKFAPGVIDTTELRDILFANNDLASVVFNLDKFDPGVIDHTDLASRLIATGEKGIARLAENLDKFESGALTHAQLDTVNSFLAKEQADAARGALTE